MRYKKRQNEKVICNIYTIIGNNSSLIYVCACVKERVCV